LAEVVDLSRLVVSASIRSVDAAKVKRGQRVELSPGSGSGTSSAVSPAAAPPALTVPSTIVYIGPQVDSATDTVIVRARVPAGAPIRPGQFINVRIVAEERADRLAVPVESIVQGGGGSEVALVQGDTAIRTPVKTGLREGALVEVEGQGLRAGVPVVLQGAYGLLPKTKIKVISR
jgi:membrane fusion protein (multidrug efflux system)